MAKFVFARPQRGQRRPTWPWGFVGLVVAIPDLGKDSRVFEVWALSRLREPRKTG